MKLFVGHRCSLLSPSLVGQFFLSVVGCLLSVHVVVIADNWGVLHRFGLLVSDQVCEVHKSIYLIYPVFEIVFGFIDIVGLGASSG